VSCTRETILKQAHFSERSQAADLGRNISYSARTRKAAVTFDAKVGQQRFGTNQLVDLHSTKVV